MFTRDKLFCCISFGGNVQFVYIVLSMQKLCFFLILLLRVLFYGYAVFGKILTNQHQKLDQIKNFCITCYTKLLFSTETSLSSVSSWTLKMSEVELFCKPLYVVKKDRPNLIICFSCSIVYSKRNFNGTNNSVLKNMT